MTICHLWHFKNVKYWLQPEAMLPCLRRQCHPQATCCLEEGLLVLCRHTHYWVWEEMRRWASSSPLRGKKSRGKQQHGFPLESADLCKRKAEKLIQCGSTSKQLCGESNYVYSIWLCWKRKEAFQNFLQKKCITFRTSLWFFKNLSTYTVTGIMIIFGRPLMGQLIQLYAMFYLLIWSSHKIKCHLRRTSAKARVWPYR